MKIALLLSGNLNQFCYKDKYNKSCAELWKENVTKYNMDVFCYTEDNNFYYNDVQYFSNINNTIDTRLLVTNGNIERIYKNTKFINYDDSKIIIENLLKCYFDTNLKKFNINKLQNDNNDKIYNKDNINHKIFMEYTKSNRNTNQKYGILSQFYKLKQCFNLMCEYENENNFKYDIVIRSRFDLILDNINKINITNFNYNNILYTTVLPCHICDWWAIGNRHIMEIYCSYYDNISQNLINNKFQYIYHKNGAVIKYSDTLINKDNNTLINNTKDIDIWDISDSSEVGLTYILKLNNYTFMSNNISYSLRKEY